MWSIILLQDIPNYSEFLLSFALLTFLSIWAFGLFRAVLNNQRLFWASWLVLLLTTFIPYETITSNQLGLLIGTRQFASYPVLQYIPFYLIGMYFSRNRIAFDFRLFGASVFASAAYLLFILIAGKTPDRFPPSIYWILSPMFYLYLIYLGSKLYVDRGYPVRLIENLGRNVLFYLLISNLLIFVVKSYKPNIGLNTLEGFGVTLIILGTLSYLIWIISAKPTHRSQLEHDVGSGES